MKEKNTVDTSRISVARVHNTYLYLDELEAIITKTTSKEDSVNRLTTYINNWIKKQLLIGEALKRMNVNEAEVERKVLDYRYSLIRHAFQQRYVQQHLTDSISEVEIEAYYKDHVENFILKRSIIKGIYIQVSQKAPRTRELKNMIYATDEESRSELKSYCLRFSTAYYLHDLNWIDFEKLIASSPLDTIADKVGFLRKYSYFETKDDAFLYFLKIDAFKTLDDISPLEFVKEDIKDIIINRRKVDLARKQEEELYRNAYEQKDFEIYYR